MPDITHNHPAVKALELEGFDHEGGTMHGWRCEHPDRYPSYCTCPEEAVAIVRDNLTADDLRDTDAAEEIRTEGWMQGWAAGRDLDGDEDATKYLRDTPAGRALMAEGWDALIESMSASGEFHDVDLRTMQRLNPYRGGDA